MAKYKIEKVAIYLRKSRNENEEEDVLRKHRRQLIEHADKKGWRYDIFEEGIESGERKKIDRRFNERAGFL